MTGKGCEALSILLPYLALSKVQLHVGINILHGASIKLPPEPMISVIFEYMLSTPASGMPFRTWYQTILPILLMSGIFKYFIPSILPLFTEPSLSVIRLPQLDRLRVLTCSPTRPICMTPCAWFQTIFSSSLEPATYDRPDTYDDRIIPFDNQRFQL